MKKLFSMILAAAVLAACLLAQDAKVAGTWQMSMDSPHGPVQGPLEIKQEGARLSGSYTVEGMGTFTFTGKVEGKNISINLEVPGADHPFGVNGTVEGNKMGGKTDLGGSWSAEHKS